MEVRTLEQNFNNEENIIEGIAIRFNSVSNVLFEKGKYFREVISPEAITQELIDNSDIRFLVNHDKDKLVARRRKGKGSLDVELREDGVHFKFIIPNTTIGNDLKEQIKRGEITQCSFAFDINPKDCTWDFSTDIPTRTINTIQHLYDLSAVYTPAYDETEISARSLEDVEKEYVENTEWHIQNNKLRELIGN